MKSPQSLEWGRVRESARMRAGMARGSLIMRRVKAR